MKCKLAIELKIALAIFLLVIVTVWGMMFMAKIACATDIERINHIRDYFGLEHTQRMPHCL